MAYELLYRSPTYKIDRPDIAMQGCAQLKKYLLLVCKSKRRALKFRAINCDFS